MSNDDGLMIGSPVWFLTGFDGDGKPTRVEEAHITTESPRRWVIRASDMWWKMPKAGGLVRTAKGQAGAERDFYLTRDGAQNDLEQLAAPITPAEASAIQDVAEVERLRREVDDAKAALDADGAESKEGISLADRIEALSEDRLGEKVRAEDAEAECERLRAEVEEWKAKAAAARNGALEDADAKIRPLVSAETPAVHAACDADDGEKAERHLGIQQGLVAALKEIRALKSAPAEPGSAGGVTQEVAIYRAALEPFAHFAERWDAKPLRSTADDLYGIHAGNPEFEAVLRLSDCRRARDVLDGVTEPVFTAAQVREAALEEAAVRLEEMWVGCHRMAEECGRDGAKAIRDLKR